MASFNEAFSSARKSGKKTFRWQGKSYTTKLASDTPKPKPRSPKPTAKPQKQGPTKDTVKASTPGDTRSTPVRSAAPGPKLRDALRISVPYGALGRAGKPAKSNPPAPAKAADPPKQRRSMTGRDSGVIAERSVPVQNSPTPAQVQAAYERLRKKKAG